MYHKKEGLSSNFQASFFQSGTYFPVEIFGVLCFWKLEDGWNPFNSKFQVRFVCFREKANSEPKNWWFSSLADVSPFPSGIFTGSTIRTLLHFENQA